ncbi:hypothetical protein L249_5730 [Ophiocordyceps polyrhachis-furcata BCC 54312]|uniref:Uncharacterized protein n=1 Tax=Ophiocordyceps polyrhachis-furcata BCC 54312 TaxID=1330021 RepID=A0A367KZT6_9HYPO|nr:hypothetical protein L249_5730 [Ophiocordyceps polyrhachis-furcata BCC 54312]
MEDQFGGRTDDDLFYDDVEPVDGATVIINESQRAQENPPPSQSLASSIFADKSQVPGDTAAVTSVPAYRDSRYRKSDRIPSRNTAANAEARLKSGSNPRQKLTDEELAAKMEKMKLLAAEKTRKFLVAEQDERQHAAAYARGMEEDRRRRADDACRRRRAEEDKRKLDDERARNRERKLKAMNAKDGGWDEGKTAAAAEEARRGFRSAHGGVRGVKDVAATATRPRGSRGRDFADRPDVGRFLEPRRFGGRASGPRGGAHPSLGRGKDPTSTTPANTAAPALTVDEFPALPPGASNGNKAVVIDKAPVIPPLSTPPAGGKWDDEMEALDLKKDTS